MMRNRYPQLKSKMQSFGRSNVLVPRASRQLARDHKSSARWLQILMDFSAVISLLLLHTWMKGAEFDTEYRVMAVLTILLMMVVYKLNGVYSLNASTFVQLVKLTRSWLIVVALLVAIGFVTKTSTAFSREVIITWSATALLGQYFAHYLVRQLQRHTNSTTIPTLIVGTGNLATLLAAEIEQNPWVHDTLIGMIEDDQSNSRSNETNPLGHLNELETIITKNKIQRVYIALPIEESSRVSHIFERLSVMQLDIIWVPDIFSMDLLNHSMRELAGLPMISLSETPMLGSSAFLKTTMDFIIAISAITVLLPLMLMTAIAIKLSSPGPILFTQKRRGWNGEEITIYKFRSMKVHQEPNGVVTQAKRNDERVTWVGRWIRKTSVDELPQLLNVLSGSMSIVGPRPHALSHDVEYSAKIKDYLKRHRVKPGITGLAQVNGYRGETTNIELMESRIQHDLAYINNWSVWLDLQIIFKTLFVLFDKEVY